MQKKKSLLVLGTLFSLLLSACGGGTPSSSAESSSSSESSSSESSSGNPHDEIVLEKDLNPNYQFDNTVTNVNGSASYEIFVRSFYDADGDGIGDFKGIEKKVPYLADLGVKTLWLMPIHPSTTYHGYEVDDYYGVHSDFGTMDDFDSMVKEARKYNIDIMIDMVINHSSKRISWFEQSYQDYKNKKTGEDSYADYYIWSDNSKGSGKAKYKDLWYQYPTVFVSSMPKLNLASEKLKNEIENITKHWINHGVKGFRLDAAMYYYGSASTASNAEFLTWLEETAHKYDPEFYMVSEVWSSGSTVLSYYQSKCDSFFTFDASFQSSEGISDTSFSKILGATWGRPYSGVSQKWLKATEKYERKLKEANPNGYSSYFLTNHDGDRLSTFYRDEPAKLAASVYMLMPGTPFMYYGEEIGLLGKRITSPEDGTDVRRRLPLIWSKEDKTGQCVFPEPTRKDLDDGKQVELGINDQLEIGYSQLNHYKKLINIRNKYPLFKQAKFTSMYDQLEKEDNYVAAYKLSVGDDYIIVVHNLNPYNVTMKAPGTEIIEEINTIQLKPSLKDGVLGLGGYSTVIMR